MTDKIAGGPEAADVLNQVASELGAPPPAVAPEEPTAEAPPPESRPATCVHCGWASDRPEPETPSEEDTLRFKTAVVARERFTKKYSLLGGQFVVTFRTLTVDELDACFTQVAFDSDNRNLLDPQRYFATLNDYQFVLGLEALESPGQAFSFPAMDRFDLPPFNPTTARATRVLAVKDHVYKNVLRQQTIRQMLGAAYFRFCRLTDHLVARADDPNF